MKNGTEEPKVSRRKFLGNIGRSLLAALAGVLIFRAKKEELGVTDASGAGKLTGVVMKELQGSADGNLVKEVVASLLV